MTMISTIMPTMIIAMTTAMATAIITRRGRRIGIRTKPVCLNRIGPPRPYWPCLLARA